MASQSFDCIFRAGRNESAVASEERADCVPVNLDQADCHRGRQGRQVAKPGTVFRGHARAPATLIRAKSVARSSAISRRLTIAVRGSSFAERRMTKSPAGKRSTFARNVSRVRRLTRFRCTAVFRSFFGMTMPRRGSGRHSAGSASAVGRVERCAVKYRPRATGLCAKARLNSSGASSLDWRGNPGTG